MNYKDLSEMPVTNLEDYAVYITLCTSSLKALSKMHFKALNAGIMPEDMECRSNLMILELARMQKIHTEQLIAIMELLPDDFDLSENVQNFMNE